MKKLSSGSYIVIILCCFASLITFLGMSLHDIPPGYAVLVYDKSNQKIKTEIHTQGILFIVPFKEETIRYKYKTQKLVFSDILILPDRIHDSISVRLNNQSILNLEIEITFHLNKNQILDIHNRFGHHHIKKHFIPIVESHFKLFFSKKGKQFIESDSLKNEYLKELKDKINASIKNNYGVVEEIKFLRILK